MLFSRILSFLTPLLTMIIAVAVVFYPANFYYFIFIVLVLNALTVWRFFNLAKQIETSRILFFIWRLAGILFGFFGLLILLENLWILNLLAVCLGATLYIFYSNLFFYLFRKRSFADQKTDNLYFNFSEIILVFVFITAVFGLQDFLNYALWLMALIFLLFFYFGSAARLFVKQRVNFKVNLIKAAPATIIFTETAFVFWLLPLVYYVKSALFLIVYILFGSFYYQQPGYFFRSKRKKFYLLTGIIMATLLLLFARWF